MVDWETATSELKLYPTALGEGEYYPLPHFLDSSKTTADIGTKLSETYLESIQLFLPNFLEKNCRDIVEEMTLQ